MFHDLKKAIKNVLDNAQTDANGDCDLDDIHNRGWCYLEVDSRLLCILKKEAEICFEEPPENLDSSSE